MRTFIEVIASGTWDEDIQDYLYDDVDAPTFFAFDQIQWFQQHEDFVVIGIIGYETVFKTKTSAFIDARQKSVFACVIIHEEE